MSALPASRVRRLEADLALDAAFFEAMPSRSYRARLAFDSELAEGHLPPQPNGWRWFCAIRQIALGVRVRSFFTAKQKLAREPIGEDLARQLFEDAVAGNAAAMHLHTVTVCRDGSSTWAAVVDLRDGGWVEAEGVSKAEAIRAARSFALQNVGCRVVIGPGAYGIRS